MNASIVSAEAKARLTEAVKNYAPPAPKKYRALEEVKECIIELRKKQASYQTIRAMLKDNAGIEISHQTIARFCREVLDAARAKKPRRSNTPTRPSHQHPLKGNWQRVRHSANHGHADRATPIQRFFSAAARCRPSRRFKIDLCAGGNKPSRSDHTAQPTESPSGWQRLEFKLTDIFIGVTVGSPFRRIQIDFES